MNNPPNPLMPQGSLEQASARSSSNVRIAVITIISIHVVFFGGLLLQGCKREPKVDPTGAATNTNSALSFPPIDANYYSNANTMPTELGSTNLAGTTSSLAFTDPGTNFGPASFTTNASTLDTAPVTTAPVVTAEMKEYTVGKGDSFYKIAKAHGITIGALSKANPNADSSKLKVGQKLQLPAPTAAATTSGASTVGEQHSTAPAPSAAVHAVKTGETLTKIAKQHGVTLKALRAANGLKTDRVVVGQKLKIPARTSGSTGAAHASTASAGH